MDIFREGNLINSDISTGDILSVRLFRNDLDELVDHRFTGNRFCQFRHQNLGWDSMDKAHIALMRPELHPDYDEKLVTLSLDPGGDLYFTIWETDKLRVAQSCEAFPIDEILDHDPSGKLERIGIVKVRFMGLSALASELYEPKWVLPD